MTIASTRAPTDRYDAVAVALHWIIALLVLAGLVLAWRIEGLEGAARGAPIRLHKSIGVTILLLALVRLAWRLTHRPPLLDPALSSLERKTARAVHVAFYGLLILQPLVGWAMISADAMGRPTLVWGVIPWPRIRPLADLAPMTREAWHSWLGGAHLALGLLMAALILVHALGALKHAFLDRPPKRGRMPPL